MSASARVEVGQRYRTIRPDGGAAQTVWNVVKVYVPWHGGLEHACLKSVDGSAGAMPPSSSGGVSGDSIPGEGASARGGSSGVGVIR